MQVHVQGQGYVHGYKWNLEEEGDAPGGDSKGQGEQGVCEHLGLGG